MCIIADHDTRKPVDVFNCRYGEKLDEWLKANSQIQFITRDGTIAYAHAVSENLPLARQVADRFHLVKNLSDGVISSIQKLLYQTNDKYPLPHPSTEEAYQYMFNDICRMGDKKHREKLSNYLKIKEMTTEGYKLTEIATHIGKSSTYIYNLTHGKSLTEYMDDKQRKAMRYISKAADMVGSGIVTVATMIKRMDGKLDSYLISRMMRTIISVYTEKRKLVREHNKVLQTSKSKKKVPVASIRHFIFKGETKNDRLLKLQESNKGIIDVVNLFIDFRKMLKNGKGELDEWTGKAKKSKNNSLVKFAYNPDFDSFNIFLIL